MKNQIYSAGIYCRTALKGSVDSQCRNSVDNQKQELTQYAETHGIHIHDYYVDDGQSGRTLDRPALRQMFSDIENRKIDCVITADLDRLARSMILTYECKRIFADNHIRFIAVKNEIDTLRGCSMTPDLQDLLPREWQMLSY